MRNMKSLAAGCVLLVVLTGCQRTVVVTESFVNKSDPAQVLKLESQPSLNYDFLGRFRNAEAAGVYTLKTDSGTISGTYTYVVDSQGKIRQYTFHPQQGERWTAKLDSHGSFTDEKGSPWRIQQFKKVDTQAKVALHIGG